MTTEQITIIMTILVLFVLSLVIYFGVKKLAGIKLNVIGLLFFWPIVMALVNRFTLTTKIVGVVFALVGFYLLFRSCRRVSSS